RLVEVWNSIPGLTPVKKFKDRKAAVSRIWKAIQSLDGGTAEPATAAPKVPKKAKADSKKAKPAPKGKPAKAAKAQRAKTGGKPAAARDGSKKAEVLALVQRKGGAAPFRSCIIPSEEYFHEFQPGGTSSVGGSDCIGLGCRTCPRATARRADFCGVWRDGWHTDCTRHCGFELRHGAMANNPAPSGVVLALGLRKRNRNGARTNC